MKKRHYRITTTEDELSEGLFGQVALHVFEVLPYLHTRSIFPEWDIRSKLYGTEPNYTVIPGIFDLAYEITTRNSAREIKLNTLRKAHISVLGCDWKYMHELWHSYFKIPDRIISRANEVGDLSNSLGIHYRGTDKNESWHTNAVSQENFLILAQDFINRRPDIKSIFVATDEFSFVEKAKAEFGPLKIINLGAVEFHKKTTINPQKGERALLDCSLLSRCKYLLKGSSALSGFAKVINPDLEAYRVSASKLFADIPYFPEAYLPKLTSECAKCQAILAKQFAEDWLQNPKARRFVKPFSTKSRHTLLQRLRNNIRFASI